MIQHDFLAKTSGVNPCNARVLSGRGSLLLASVPSDASLLRNTFSSDPINPAQPQPIYYILRTLSTALEDVKPSNLDVTVKPDHKDIESWTLERGDNEVVIALWLAGQAVDDASREHVTGITFPKGHIISASGIDSLNGTQFDLRPSAEGMSIPGIHVRDWPLIITVRMEN